jgi:hypothetical protein
MASFGEFPIKKLGVGQAHPQTLHTYPLMLSSTISVLSGTIHSSTVMPN